MEQGRGCGRTPERQAAHATTDSGFGTVVDFNAIEESHNVKPPVTNEQLVAGGDVHFVVMKCDAALFAVPARPVGFG